MGAVDAGRALYNEGRYAEAAQRTRERCWPTRAVVSKRMRVIAANDPELHALHDEPAFKELIGSGP